MSSRTTPPRTKMVESSFPLFDRLGAPRCLLERSFFTPISTFAREAPSADDAHLRHRHSAHGSDTRLRSILCSRGGVGIRLCPQPFRTVAHHSILTLTNGSHYNTEMSDMLMGK